MWVKRVEKSSETVSRGDSESVRGTRLVVVSNISEMKKTASILKAKRMVALEKEMEKGSDSPRAQSWKLPFSSKFRPCASTCT